MNISGSRAVSLLPFGYFAATRIDGPRDLAYHAATSWLPAILLLFRLTDMDVTRSVTTFAVGYLAFIAIYEIGYLVNDAWDARRTGEGRARLGFSLDWPYLAAFLAIRIGLWGSIAMLTGWAASPPWLAGYAALAFAFSQHNLVRHNGLRIASFYGLATLRCVLPVVAAIPAIAIMSVLLVAMILYAFQRLLAYMESKDLLNLAKRRDPSFGFFLLLSFAPLTLFFAYVLQARILAELTAYYLVIHGGWWLFSAVRAPRRRHS